MASWVKGFLTVPSTLKIYDWSNSLANFEKLWALVQRTDQISKATQLDLKSRFSVIQDLSSEFDSDSDVDSDLSSESHNELIEDLCAYTEILADLTPALMNPASDLLIDEEICFSTEVLSGISQPARPFALAIRDRFPSLDTQIIRRLAEANWNRRQRLRDKLSAATSQETESHGDEIMCRRGESHIESSSDHRSNYLSVTTRTDFSQSSIFDRDSILPGSSAYSVAESVNSFASSAASGLDSGRRRVPLLPEDHDFELPFQCQICGDILSQIRHRADWKKHVFNDLEPYICLMSDCDIGHHTFKSRTAWSNHEFQKHRVDAEWHCNLCNRLFHTQLEFRAHLNQTIGASQIEEIVSASKRLVTRNATSELCPFCATVPAQTQKGFASHVGKHQEEIGLAALPNLDNRSGDSSTDSGVDDSHDDQDDRASKAYSSEKFFESVPAISIRANSMELSVNPSEVQDSISSSSNSFYLGTMPDINTADLSAPLPSMEEVKARTDTKPKESPTDHIGLNLLYEISDPKVDIVLVHGLGGGSRKTWTKSSNPQQYWPKEWLSRDPDFCDVRVNSFGYNSFGTNSSVSSILDLAKALLFALRHTAHMNSSQTKIVFIAHNIGGLVIKQAVLLAHHDPDFASLTSRFKYIYFLGTPHRGTDSDIAQILSRIITLDGHNKQSIEDLNRTSQSINVINQQFRPSEFGLSIYSFYETLATSKKTRIVDKRSATSGYWSEMSAGLNTDHQGMTNFEDQRDPNYIELRNALASTVNKIMEEFRIGRPFAGKEGDEEETPKYKATVHLRDRHFGRERATEEKMNTEPIGLSTKYDRTVDVDEG